MKIDWYYSDEASPSDELVDNFADSKFGIDKWSSFAREIIQNSLDAQDDSNSPVEVRFDLNKELGLKDIPGGKKIKEVLEKCANIATNKQTKSAYTKGLEVLSKDRVYCMKVSDRNTRGVETGRDNAWGALVFDEGKSIKQRPGSAGSHGVGKKVPFIISSCNTVFYATKNKYVVDGDAKSDCLLQGKTTLITWRDDDGKRKNSKGWYGAIDEKCEDTQTIIKPITSSDFDGINPFFIRSDDYGTDVIIIGVNAYGIEEIISKCIINAILENFFVAIVEGKLIVDVFGIGIDSTSFRDVSNRFYEGKRDSKNSLNDCMRVYSSEPEIINISNRKGEEIGSVEIFFDLGNDGNKKYYTVVRSHGMRIVDYRVNKASQPYTAVVMIKGEKLNQLLSLLENAAHDDFVTNDENIELDGEAIYALNKVRELVSEYICQKTKFDDSEGQELSGLSELISIPGLFATVKRKSVKNPAKVNRIPKKGKGSRGDDYDQGKTGGQGDGNGSNSKGQRSPAKEGDDQKCILYTRFKSDPVFIKTDSEFYVEMETKDDINADLVFRSVNSDGKNDSSINDYLDCIYDGTTKRNVEKGRVKNIIFKGNEHKHIVLHLKKDVTYQINVEVYRKDK